MALSGEAIAESVTTNQAGHGELFMSGQQVIMTPMANFRKQRAERKRFRMRAMGKVSQRVQAAKRMERVTPEYLRELEEIEIQNFPRREGDALGCLQWTDFRTGKVRRWTVRIGDRIDRVTLHAPDGRKTASHGWTWVMDHLRGFLCGSKA